MKAKMTVYKGGGKAPVSSMGKKLVKYQNGGKSPNTTTTPPTVKLQGATVVANKGQGLETQYRVTVPKNEYLAKEKELMDKELVKYKERHRSIDALKYITPTERSMMKDNIRDEMYKQGLRKDVKVWKDTGKEATPEEVAKYKRLEEQRKKGY